MYVSEIRNLCCGDLCAPKTDSDDFLAREFRRNNAAQSHRDNTHHCQQLDTLACINYARDCRHCARNSLCIALALGR